MPTQALTTLNLRCNEISGEGAQHIAQALQNNMVRLNFILIYFKLSSMF